MIFTLRIEMHNDAFKDDGVELGRILAQLAVAVVERTPDVERFYTILDVNGNWAGEAEVQKA